MLRRLYIFQKCPPMNISKSGKSTREIIRSKKYSTNPALTPEKSSSENQIMKMREDPEKKVTLISKWTAYWRTLFNDYYEVGKDIVAEVKNKPVKGVTLFSLFASTVYCAKNNPDLDSFRTTVLRFSNDFIFVGPSIRNPKAKEHLKLIEQSYNTRRLRFFSFGLFSIIWIDNNASDLGLYKTSCSYLKPDWFTFHNRVLDIGFLNKWWIIEKKMIDFDINPEEWNETIE